MSSVQTNSSAVPESPPHSTLESAAPPRLLVEPSAERRISSAPTAIPSKGSPPLVFFPPHTRTQSHFATMTCYGLYYYNQHTLTPLPLLQVRASASIKDLSATVQLSQDFTNDSDNTIECSYGFPVPARASVTAFSLLKSDGTRIFGIVQEKDEAKETYEKAVEEGKLASLMEQQTPDSEYLVSFVERRADFASLRSLRRLGRQPLASREGHRRALVLDGAHRGRDQQLDPLSPARPPWRALR